MTWMIVDLTKFILLAKMFWIQWYRSPHNWSSQSLESRLESQIVGPILQYKYLIILIPGTTLYTHQMTVSFLALQESTLVATNGFRPS
jgi:hypothetical protein